MTLVSGALLNILLEAGEAVMTLTETVEDEEFFASRLTQREVVRQMRILSTTIGNVAPELRRQMAEIDWSGWEALSRQLGSGDDLAREALWFGVRSLVPATLLWLRVYRQQSPELFAMVP